jgi:hypothetical protein
MSIANNKPARRWYRISIRALMLLVLLIAVWLGWHANRAREQREAVAAVQRSGGWVHYDYEFKNGKLTPGQSPWAPRWLRAALGDEFFQNVQQVSLVYDDLAGKRFDNANVQPCDDVLKAISKLPGLKSLLLKETQATDEGARHIGAMNELEELFIWDARSVTDVGVSQLSRLKNLKNVHINQSNLTDDSLALLSSLPGIEELSLQKNHFSDKGLARLGGKDRLKRLYLGMSDGRITDAGLAHLKDFTKLELLDVQHSEVTLQGLTQLQGLPKLKTLWLSGVPISVSEGLKLQAANPNLRITGLK